MSRISAAGILGSLFVAATPAAAQTAAGPANVEAAPGPEQPPAEYAQPIAEEAGTPPPIPPYVEGTPIPAPQGGYCYGGPHPADPRFTPGTSWDPQPGRHLRPYPPIDLRLFAVKDGCYYFIGDPRDFGYSGDGYSYYGAHPVHDGYGGGWCFMIGPHTHHWRPWSSHFTLVGSWYYWEGAYDPFFWSYWPYYSFYYRSYYPHYYGGGRFYHRGYGHHAAPAITRVPRPRGGTWQGRPAAEASTGVPPGRSSAGWGAGPAPAGRSWGGSPGGAGHGAAGAVPPAPARRGPSLPAAAPAAGSSFAPGKEGGTPPSRWRGTPSVDRPSGGSSAGSGMRWGGSAPTRSPGHAPARPGGGGSPARRR